MKSFAVVSSTPMWVVVQSPCFFASSMSASSWSRSMPPIFRPSKPSVLAWRTPARMASGERFPRFGRFQMRMRGATIVPAALSARHCFDFSVLPPTSRVVVVPVARYRFRSYWIGCGTSATRDSCQCMWVLTRPGMTYLPVASITASAVSPWRGGPTRAIRPSSTRMSTGPNGAFFAP
jgi:hypothetical protein